MEHTVFATTDSVSLGHFPYPQDDAEPVTKSVTYRNVSDTDVTLDLSVEVTDERGAAPAPGVLGLASHQVTVPAGGTAEVDLNVDPQAGDYGLYGGWVHAVDEASGTELRTAVGFFKETERYDIRIRGIDRDGSPAGGISVVDVINLDDLSVFARGQIDLIGGTTTVRVPPGNYAVMGFIGEALGDELTLAFSPELSVTEDTSVVLDARQAVPVEVDTAHETEVVDFVAKFQRVDARGRSVGHTYSTNARARMYVTPTEPVGIGDLEFYTKWTLVAPGEESSPYLYDLLLPESGHIPDSLTYTIDETNTAQVDVAFHSHVPDHAISDTRSYYQPWESGSSAFMRRVVTPHQRTDYVSAGETRWNQSVVAGSTGLSFYNLYSLLRTYEPGEQVQESWMSQVTRPAFPEGSSKTGPPHRYGDTFYLRIPEWVDGSHHEGSSMSGDELEFRLYEDGELIGQSRWADGAFDAHKKSAEYRIEMDAARSHPWWQLSTRTSTAWTFQSATPAAGQEEFLPLLEVSYDVDVDLLNTATSGGAQHVGLTIAAPEGAHQAPIDQVRVWASYDDGDNWHEAMRVKDDGSGRFTAVIPPNHQPKDAAYISLRVHATDAEGNGVEQDVLRAYRLR